MSKVSLAAADAKDTAVKGYNDGKQAAESAVGATKGKLIYKYALNEISGSIYKTLI